MVGTPCMSVLLYIGRTLECRRVPLGCQKVPKVAAPRVTSGCHEVPRVLEVAAPRVTSR